MSVFGRLWTPGGSGEGGNNRSFVGTGLGWYLDSDYLRTAGSTVMGTIETSGGGGGGGGGEPLSPNTQYTDTNTGTINVANNGDLHLNISFSNVNSRVYWMWLWIGGGDVWPDQGVWCIAAISDQPFSMWMEGWGTQSASKPPSYYSTYMSLLTGMSNWSDVYGIAMGWHGGFPSGSYNYEPNYDWASIAQDFHDSVTGRPSNVRNANSLRSSFDNREVGEISYPQPSSATPYMGPFSNLPVASPGFQSRYNHNLDRYIGDYQGNNIGTARAWVFYIMRTDQTVGFTGYAVSDVSGTIVRRVYSNGESQGSWTLSSPLSGYSGFYCVSWTDGSEFHRSDMNENFIFSSLSDAMASIGVVTHTIKKVQGGAGAFAFTKFPVSGVDTYVGLGVSSVARNAEIAVDGTSTSYTTRTLDGITFTMHYTDQLAGEMTAYVPVIEVASMPSISNLSDYQTALFNAIVNASGLSVIT